jgi:hypothetical protein
MKERFSKTFGKTRRPVGRDRHDAVTGTSLAKEDQKAALQKKLDEAESEEEKKKIRQAAHFQGVSLD